MAKKIVVVCMDDYIKNELAWRLQDKGVGEDLRLLLVSLPSCSDGELIGFEEVKTKAGRGKSEYQQFIGECMKGGKKTMKQCVEEWNKKKKEKG
jgi:hypothetical protein